MRPVDEDGDGSGPSSRRPGCATSRCPMAPAPSASWSHSTARSAPTSALRAHGARFEHRISRCAPASARAGTRRLLVPILRQFGLAARFVSGYLVQLASDIRSARRAVGARRLHDLHAWAEAYIRCRLDRAGPTLGLLAGGPHSAGSAPPRQRGAGPNGGTDVCDTVLGSPTPSPHEDPRVTLPLANESWKTICEVGQRIR